MLEDFLKQQENARKLKETQQRTAKPKESQDPDPVTMMTVIKATGSATGTAIKDILPPAGNDAALYLNDDSFTTPPPYDDGDACDMLNTFMFDVMQGEGRDWRDFTMTPTLAADMMQNRPPAVIRFGYNPDTLQGYRVASRGDLSMIVGGEKTRKTTFAAAMVNTLLKGMPEGMQAAGDPNSYPLVTSDLHALKVCFFDTEQSDYHAAKTYQRIIKDLTPEQVANLVYIRLRSENHESRLRIITDCILKESPDLAIIDGIADLVTDTNSNTESPQLVGLLMATASKSGTHIMSILHNSAANRNKGRGNLGSELGRKCESVIYLTLSKDSHDTSEVSPMLTRNKTFAKMYVTHTATGDSILTADYMPPTADDGKMCAAMMQEAEDLHPGQAWFKIDELIKAHAVARKKLGGGDELLSPKAMRSELKRFVEEGFLIQDKGKGSGSPLIFTLSDNEEGLNDESAVE